MSISTPRVWCVPVLSLPFVLFLSSTVIPFLSSPIVPFLSSPVVPFLSSHVVPICHHQSYPFLSQISLICRFICWDCLQVGNIAQVNFCCMIGKELWVMTSCLARMPVHLETPSHSIFFLLAMKRRWNDLAKKLPCCKGTFRHTTYQSARRVNCVMILLKKN